MEICFILDHSLKNYRLPLFKYLSKKGYNITIIHPECLNENLLFLKQIRINQIKKLGFEYRNIKGLNKYDIVVFMQNLRIIDLWIHTLNPFKTYKLIHWGIGVSSSKGISIKRSVTSIIRDLLTRFASALVLYSHAPIDLFSKKVIKKTFIANNTVESNITKRRSREDKNSILFIGSLDKRKGLDILIKKFNIYLKNYKPKRLDKIIVIGEGPEKSNLKYIAKSLGLEENIIFTGALLNETEKWPFFKKAAVSVSLKQAGLAVLECFSYGIPFICLKNAISGGEHLNIQNGLNGYLINDEDELVNLFNKLDKSPLLTEKLSQNAFNYYHEKRTIGQMTQTFINAFEFVTNKNP